MKNLILTTVLLLVAQFMVAQDLLTLKSGKDMKTKIMEIDKDLGKVKFKNFDNLDGPLYTEKIADVLMIRYQNGTIETFTDVKREPIIEPVIEPTIKPNTTVLESKPSLTPTTNIGVPPSQSSVQSNEQNNAPNNGQATCAQGQQDAKVYYTGQNCGSGGTSATTILLSPLLGLITYGMCVSTPPQPENLGYPSAKAYENPEYRNCYTAQAHTIKKKKLGTALGVSSAIWLVLILLI